MEIPNYILSRQHLKELYTSGDSSDVHFLVGTPPVTLICHKFVLAGASEVFNAMFYGYLPEKMTVRIEDVEYDAFRNLLQYIYTEEVSISSFLMALETAYVCKKYMAPQALFNLCMLNAESYFALDDLWEAFQAAILLEDPRLSRLCKYLFVLHSRSVLKSKRFLQCSVGYLKHMIDSIADHVDPVLLFTGLVDWAVHQEEPSDGGALRCRLEPFLPNVRFLAMSFRQFARYVEPTGILKETEFKTIARQIVMDWPYRRTPTWLNQQRWISALPLDYRVLVVMGFHTKDESSRGVELVFSFQVLNNDTFLKGVYGKVGTTSLPSVATVEYVNHTKKFRATMETRVELHRPQIPWSEFQCRLLTPRLLVADDRVTVSVHLYSDGDHFIYKTGDIHGRRHHIQDGKVVIKSIPMKNSAPLSAVVFSPAM